MRTHDYEPDSKGAALIIAICFVGLIASVSFGAWAYYREMPLAVDDSIDEGEAKAALIKQLTGHTVAPEYARFVNVNLTGTTVAIETHSINLFDGKKWKELKR